MSEMTNPCRHARKLYGRRKGPKLTTHQQHLIDELLPQLELKFEDGRDPRAYFLPLPTRGGRKAERSESLSGAGHIAKAPHDVWLEIGFGGGEHLIWQAQHHPHVGLIGAEPYLNGVAKLLSRLDSLSPGTGGEGWGEGAPEVSDPAHTNSNSRSNFAVRVSASASPSPRPSPPHSWGRGRIRIYMGDARDILEALPDASLGRVFILFPDPWPKTRHHKRRFIQMEMLDQLARVMKPGAELRFASDDAGYVAWTLERTRAHSEFEWTAARSVDWKTRPPDWPPTRYEAKELHGQPVFLTFTRSAPP